MYVLKNDYVVWGLGGGVGCYVYYIFVCLKWIIMGFYILNIVL